MANHEQSRAALQTLYERYADGIFRLAMYTLMNEADAMDTVQETFLRAYRSWDGFRGDAAAKTWLVRIAKNCMVDSLRKRKTERIYQDRERSLQPQTSELVTDIEVQEVLEQLPPAYRDVVLLRAVEGLSVAQTARVLRLSDTNVRVTYHRAKKLLDRLLNSTEEPAWEGGRVK